ncbi:MULTISPECIES: ABC transporter substrate-binding protein [unclassified Enterococcus]|uniref:ABC transporter substrate-binding protein n=1 Tax=unclassified Enterococcus TaxID=2608891 RepID=UPI001552E29C|nr:MULTISPECIES: ABC transporter substrate-binding protein [unclassified Enterococcus]MBS7577424.1 ABC transporter substrate-binding protein [Enterococcus sp. MMGLQ5-2]MBS7584831.1 ABC transporter substrate-binding protein [Enterococcus sp. MMGLQ5-1]NPD12686.1 ABC transporter substrate-binding protein [Enterococcus sp. MMGLQ5-1]NPD37258.1 ABC transporter substrate-binding protein [Enterococcus sp. MMGLQ5-2]
MKKGIIGLALASLLLLAACSSSNNEAKDTSKEATIGVLQMMKHASLDAAYEGFKEGLKEEGYEEGKNLTINYQVGTGAQDSLKSMSETLVKKDPDLLLGIATPAAISLLNETTDIPIVITAVTDPVESKLVASEKKPGGNVTGTTDMVPIEKQVKLLLSIKDNIKTVGIAYNAGEGNSKIQADLAIEALKKEGVETKVLTANSTNDVQSVMTSLAKNTDAIYIPTDNTFATAAPVVGEVAKEYKIPVVAGSAEQVEAGGLATFGINYTSLGKQTGVMAAKILKGEAKPESLPIESANDLELIVNKDMASALGINPDDIKAPE